jgi:hypothetical protein
MTAPRAPRPRVPLFTGQLISVADLDARRERARLERGKDGVQRLLVADLHNRALTNGPVIVDASLNGAWLYGGGRGWKGLETDGAKKGAPDLTIGHAGVWHRLEIKREAGELSRDQERFIADAAAAGLKVHVGYGLTKCRRILTELGVFKRGAFPS